MTTSLSRQLQQLRTTTTSQPSPGSSIFSSGPFVIDQTEYLDQKQLEILSRESFETLCSQCPSIGKFGGKVFNDEAFGDNVEDECDWQQDLLLLLTPYGLTRSAQFLIQWLITQHQLHQTHPEALIWSMMPHFEYKIFYRIVEAVNVLPSARYPKWFPVFKASCFPSTKTGLYKLVACDKGFFKLLCNWVLKTKGHHIKYREANYDQALFFFCSTLLNGLKLCSNLAEHQVHGIVQVILCGLKSGHPEFFALGATLLTRTFPFVRLRNKVVAKVTKSLGKLIKTEATENTLYLLLILYRTQKEVMDGQKLISLMAYHKSVVKSVFEKLEDVECCLRMVVNLNEMSNEAHRIPQPNESILVLFDMILQGISALELSSEVSSSLISNVSKNYLHFKAQKKDKKGNLVMKTLMKDIANQCKRILASLRKKYPVEYLQNSHIQTSDVDIIVVSGDSDIMPTLEQMNAKRILLDNELIRRVKHDIWTMTKKDRSYELKKLLKESSSAIAILFGTVEPSFLIQQTEPDELVNMTFNLIRLYEKKKNVVRPILNFISSESFKSSEEIKQVLNSNGIILELIFLPFLWMSNQEPGSILTEVEINFPRNHIISKSLQGLKVKEPKPIEVWDRFAELASEEFLLEKCKLVLDSKVHQVPELFSILICAIITKMRQGKCRSNAYVIVLLRLLEFSGNNFEILPLKEGRENNLWSCILLAKLQKNIAIPLLHACSEVLNEIKNVQDFLTLSLITNVLQTWKKKLPSFYEEFNRVHINWLEDLNFSEKWFCHLWRHLNEKEFSTAVKIHGLKTVLDCCKKSDVIRRRILCLKSLSMSALLCCIISGHQKAQSLAFKILETCSTLQKTSGHTFMPFIKHLEAYKEDIVSDISNVRSVMSKFTGKQAELIQKSLLIQFLENATLVDVRAIMPFIENINAKQEMSKVSRCILDWLENEQNEFDDLLVITLETFLPAIVKSRSDAKCKQLVNKLIADNNKAIIINGRVSYLTCIGLQVMAEKCGWKDEKEWYDIFCSILDHCADSDNNDILDVSRKVIQKMPDKQSMFLRVLQKMWHQSNPGQNRNSKTIFLLELFRVEANMGTRFIDIFFIILKNTCDEDNEGNAYYIDLILSCILQVVKGSSESEMKDLHDKAIKPELLVHCIKACHNPNSKSSALLILAKSSVVNAEYVLQNSIPIFTFMGTHFLKVDSKYSFNVACQAVDIIIPHIQKICLIKGPWFLQQTNINILITFVDASLDMPAYRWKTFLKKLVTCLGPKDHLWILSLMLLRVLGKKRNTTEDSNQNPSQESTQHIIDLFTDFPIKIQVEGMLQMMVNMKQDSLTIRKLLKLNENQMCCDDIEDEHDEDLNQPLSAQSGNDFVVLQLNMMSFVKSVLICPAYSKKLLESSGTGENLSQQMRLLIECTIINLDQFQKMPSSLKQKKYLVQFSEKVFETSLRILPNKLFQKALNNLLTSENKTIQRKALEVLNTKLQEQDSFVNIISEYCPSSLINALVDLSLDVNGQDAESNDMVMPQLALLCLRSLSKRVASGFPGEFKAACVKLTERKFLKSLSNPNVIASALLCITEIFQSIGPYSVPLLRSFVVWMVKLMSNNDGHLGLSPILLNSLILSVQKLMEHFSGFLNPYYKDFVVGSCLLHSFQSSEQVRHSSSRLKHLQTSIAKGIPCYALLTIGKDCISTLENDGIALATLGRIFEENFEPIEKVTAMNISPQVMEVFKHAFNIRQTTSNLDLGVINVVEEAFIKAFLAITLKLSLDDFKPLFFNAFNQTFDVDHDIKSYTTAFHITFAVAQKLKSMFDFITESLIEKSTVILQAYAKNQFELLRNVSQREGLNFLIFLIDSLDALFTFNKTEEISYKKFEEHVNALLTYFQFQFEEEESRQLFYTKIARCLKHLASSTDDETQWKYLNYNLVILLRSSPVEIRSTIFKVIEMFVEEKGENYMSVLPDAVPFLSEMLEDEDPKIEEECKELIKKMEEVFGQSIESYFE